MRPVATHGADIETRVPQAERRQAQSGHNTGKPVPGDGAVPAVAFGPRFAKEIGLRLTEGLDSGLPPAISERLRNARELAIANRRK